jgi:hypothetical protein
MSRLRPLLSIVRCGAAEAGIVAFSYDDRPDDRPRRLGSRAAFFFVLTPLIMLGSMSLFLAESPSVALGVGALLGATATGSQAVKAVRRALVLEAASRRGSPPTASY